MHKSTDVQIDFSQGKAELVREARTTTAPAINFWKASATTRSAARENPWDWKRLERATDLLRPRGSIFYPKVDQRFVVKGSKWETDGPWT